MSEGQGMFDKAKDKVNDLKDKVTGALRPDDEDQQADDEEEPERDPLDRMRAARDETDDDPGGMAF